ncbi:hypothetical protein [Streptomyces sp. NPDC005143]
MPELLRTAEGEYVEVHILAEYYDGTREVEIDGERCWLLVDICARLDFRRSNAREPEWVAANVRNGTLRPVTYSIPSRNYYVHGWAINSEGIERLSAMSGRTYMRPKSPGRTPNWKKALNA